MKWRLFALGLLSTLSCRKPSGVVQEAEFGVFFGGQVQELKQIEKELDPARQLHGFRLTFPAALEREVDVGWEIALPAGEKPGPRAAVVGQTRARVGQRILDVPLSFRPTDPLGTWHVRVTADHQPVIDRDFVLVAPSSRPKLTPKPLAPRASGP